MLNDGEFAVESISLAWAHGHQRGTLLLQDITLRAVGKRVGWNGINTGNIDTFIVPTAHKKFYRHILQHKNFYGHIIKYRKKRFIVINYTKGVEIHGVGLRVFTPWW